MKSSVTVGKKLLISIGAMLLIMTVMGITALSSINSLDGELENAVNRTARRLQLSGEMETAASDMLAGMRGIVMYTFASDAATVDACSRQFSDAANRWQKAIDEVKPLITRDDERQTANRMQEGLTAWKAAVAELKQAAARGDGAAAVDIALHKGFPIYQASSQSAEGFRRIQDEILVKQRESGASTYKASLWIAAGLMILAIGAGAAVMLIVRGTNRTLQHVAGELGRSADQVASAAGQIASSSQNLARGASQQAASIEETSATTEEISAMTKKNADDSHAAAGLMAEASELVGVANRSLAQMETSMRDINASSEKIGKIIKVIDGIAFQTNILALNAAVEAARAGDSGMGFAVVADEVRNLAQRSAQAARDTAGMIEEAILKSNEGQRKVEEVSSAIRAITEKDALVKSLIDCVNVSSGEQAHGVDQIAQAITQVERVTQDSAASAEQAASAGEQLTSQALALKGMVGQLEQLVGTSGQ